MIAKLESFGIDLEVYNMKYNEEKGINNNLVLNIKFFKIFFRRKFEVFDT
jgi:hypothetical protein